MFPPRNNRQSPNFCRLLRVLSGFDLRLFLELESKDVQNAAGIKESIDYATRVFRLAMDPTWRDSPAIQIDCSGNLGEQSEPLSARITQTSLSQDTAHVAQGVLISGSQRQKAESSRRTLGSKQQGARQHTTPNEAKRTLSSNPAQIRRTDSGPRPLSHAAPTAKQHMPTASHPIASASNGGSIRVPQQCSHRGPGTEHRKSLQARRQGLLNGKPPQKVEEQQVTCRRPSAIDEVGRTPLMLAALRGDLEVAIQLINEGSHVDVSDACECTALFYAAAYGHASVAKCLVESRADVNSESKSCWSPLIAAAHNGHLPAAEVLLTQGANPESADDRRWTPLMHVAFNGSNQVLRCLLQHQAKVETENSEGLTALVLAASQGHVENVESLLASGSRTTGEGSLNLALLWAASQGHEAVVQILMQTGAISSQSQKAILKRAEEHGKHEVVKLLRL